MSETTNKPTPASPTAGPYVAVGMNVFAGTWCIATNGNRGCSVEPDRTRIENENRANAHLFAASWDFAAACTPERLDALDELLTNVSDPGHEMTILSRELLTGLYAAVAKSRGEEVGL